MRDYFVSCTRPSYVINVYNTQIGTSIFGNWAKRMLMLYCKLVWPYHDNNKLDTHPLKVELKVVQDIYNTLDAVTTRNQKKNAQFKADQFCF